MNKPGIFNIIMGLLVFAAGGVVTAGTYAVALGGKFIVAYGAILVGAAQFLVGAGQYVAFSLKSDEQKALLYAKIDFRAFVRSLMMASADQELHASEIAIINHLAKRTFGVELDATTLNDIFIDMKSTGYCVMDDFESIHDR